MSPGTLRRRTHSGEPAKGRASCRYASDSGASGACLLLPAGEEAVLRHSGSTEHRLRADICPGRTGTMIYKMCETRGRASGDTLCERSAWRNTDSQVTSKNSVSLFEDGAGG